MRVNDQGAGAAGLRLSPSDLSGFLACRHRTGLDLAVAHGALARPAWNDPMAQALRDRGAEHERAYVTALRARGLAVTEIADGADSAARASATLEAMRAGAGVIVQAALASDGWMGYADILCRVEMPSALGGWSYEPYDTKLARETRGGTILQLATYVELLAALQGARPERFHVVTPAAVHTYRFADFAAYYRLVRRQLADVLSLGHDTVLARHYPEPVDDCEVCRWWLRCNARRRQDDHLSFIAGLTRLHRQELTGQGHATLTAVAAMPLPIAFQPTRGSREVYTRVREQARLQHEQRTGGRPVHELLPVAAEQGLARLPEPAPGDLFLDLEGARFARDGGREYLFGLWRRGEGEPSRPRYTGAWAFTDAEERAAFEAAIDRIMQAWAADPGMHVYHFGHYEPTAMKRLMGRYATRGEAVDRLLRGARFVDLHAIVRQALRAGVESYSIKQLEPFYRFVREVPLRDARAHLQAVELALEGHAPAAIPEDVRTAVQGYNRDDCRSTEALRDWLEDRRAALVAGGRDVARPSPEEDSASEQVSDLEIRQQTARTRLLSGIPAEASAPDHAQHQVWQFAYLLDWHRREDKSAWWEFFRLRDLPEQDLFDEPAAIAGLVKIERVEETRYKNGSVKSAVDRYGYPLQETEIHRGSRLRTIGADPVGVVTAHDRAGRTLDIAKGRAAADRHLTAVFEAEVIPTSVQQEALLRFSDTLDRAACGTDLLFRRPPRLHSGDFRPHDGERAADFAVRLAPNLDRTTLAVQGPPGSGKTYVGAQMIRALVAAGRRVGVTAVSHKVIRNLLDAVHEQNRRHASVAGQSPPRVGMGHRCGLDEDSIPVDDPAVRVFGENDSALAALADGGVRVLGGTSWLWSLPEAAGAVDVLFVDEAGQMSLANALAVSAAARSLVLLGDPQQLEQPQRGSHPDGVGVSALEHVLGGASTMPPERGLFLPTTWRLHPSICAFTSEVFYEGKLDAKPGLERQRLTGTGDFDGAGLWWVPVAHDGNQNSSSEEVDRVARLVEQLLAPGAMWVDEHGVPHQLVGPNLRIVAPFNAQVNRLAERLAGREVPVGTVDRFQGQEAPVVIYSMATSRAEDAPRGMEFLYSLNRLNVATSRARCAAFIVASPQLCEPVCRTPRQMVLANALCRFTELARPCQEAGSA